MNAAGKPEYGLALSRPDGGWCSASLALTALAEFGLLAALEDPNDGTAVRSFRCPA